MKLRKRTKPDRGVQVVPNLLRGVEAVAGVCTSKALSKGKYKGFPADTVHWSRVKVPLPIAPTKKNTCPDCPARHPAPVGSTKGFVEAGWAKTYCHQAADQAP